MVAGPPRLTRAAADGGVMNAELEKERRSDVITAVVLTLLAYLLAIFVTGEVVLPGPYFTLVVAVGSFVSGRVVGLWGVPRVTCGICRASPPGPIPWHCDECKKREAPKGAQ